MHMGRRQGRWVICIFYILLHTFLTCLFHLQPTSWQYFESQTSEVQAAIRNGTSTNDLWVFMQHVHEEWQKKFDLHPTLVDTANRRATISSIFRSITVARTNCSPVCRLFLGTHGIGKSHLLQLASIACKVAFGESLFVIFHDFLLNGLGMNRHSLTSIFREAIKSRWHLTDLQLDQRLSKYSGSNIPKVIRVCKELGREQSPPVNITVVLFADGLENLFITQMIPMSLLNELKSCALACGVVTFFSSSKYSIIDRLEEQNFRLYS